ncbi:recombinase family protein [Tepidibacter sp. Z1-5]|uniref:recombinase family protein n=1 Tax=Tepidibacter sp. Z1-5 TaxID=3134138 RepID=UPI0030C1A6B4
MNRLVNDPYQYAAIYARESNPNAPNAIDTQIYTCKNYAHNENILVYDVYSELVSATKVSYKQRKAFMRLIEDAKKGYFKKIILTRRDRLTRVFEEFIEIKKLFKKLDIEILYSNDIQIDEKKDYACNFLENILMGLAEMEPRRIAHRTREGQKTKIEKGIYDKRAPYGLVYDKKEKFYFHDGIKVELVKDIFEIYLKYKTVKKPKDIIKKLNKYADTKEEKSEYIALVNKLKDKDINSILSKSIYAGIYINNIDFKYKDFYINYYGKIEKVNTKYFHKYHNIQPIITPKQWYDTVEKWYENNPNKLQPKREQKRTNKIFKDLFICTKCEKVLKYKNGKFSCESKGCKGINKDVLIRDTIRDLVRFLINKEESDKNKGKDTLDNIIKDSVKKLSSKRGDLKKILVDSINKQGKLIEEYIENSTDEYIRKKITKEVKNQKNIKEKIKELDEKIIFLNNKFKKIIIPLVDSGYIHLISDELEKNQSALLEVFMYENIKELEINGHPIRIDDGTKRKKTNCSGIPQSFFN